MKSLGLPLVLVIVLFSFSCKKGEIPDSNQRYIGSWKNISDTASSYIVIINADGTAEYHEKNTSGAAYKYVDILGFVFFNGYDFKIGTKSLAGKKFKCARLPERVTVTVKPYTYYYLATFNGIEYKNNGNIKTP